MRYFARKSGMGYMIWDRINRRRYYWAVWNREEANKVLEGLNEEEKKATGNSSSIEK